MITARLRFIYGSPPSALQRRYAAKCHGLVRCMFCEQPISALRAFRIDGWLSQYLPEEHHGVIVYGLCDFHAGMPNARTEARWRVEMDCNDCNLAMTWPACRSFSWSVLLTGSPFLRLTYDADTSAPKFARPSSIRTHTASIPVCFVRGHSPGCAA